MLTTFDQLCVELDKANTEGTRLLSELAQAQARIQELEAECASGKTEIGCLTCGNKFSVLDEEEINWTCPVCLLEGLVREMVPFVKGAWSGESNTYWPDYQKSQEILNRPLVKEIMEGEGVKVWELYT